MKGGLTANAANDDSDSGGDSSSSGSDHGIKIDIGKNASKQ
jgi:hypothetical protein